MTQTKRAFITGITGQDGSYLAELLDGKGYEVHGLVRGTNHPSLERIRPLPVFSRIRFHYGELTDESSLTQAIQNSMPDEIYNLGGVSDLGTSFAHPEHTMAANFRAVQVLVEAARTQVPHARFFQASSAEMFDKEVSPQNEGTPLKSGSPYAVAKIRAYEECIVGVREATSFFACSGFLFNHESPRRGEQFVTRKITATLARIKLGRAERLELGNLDAQRDWGFAGDYARAMWMMLQQKKPTDFVIATGIAHTVREFVSEAAVALDMPLTFEGTGLGEVGKDQEGITRVRVSETYYRQNEMVPRIGDATQLRESLGWKPEVSFSELAHMMARADLKRIEQTARPL